MTERQDNTFLFDYKLSEIDHDVDALIKFEEERQRTKIIMIPSESLCPKPVRKALSSVFTNKYAEGYPSLRMSKYEREMVTEFERYLAFHRRYSDRRYYKGTEFVNFIEVLAQKRAAELFATMEIPAERIFVNVQPLSGAAANNAVYDAFLSPGDTVMGMSLSHGGHLTHGSPVNRSGKYYKVSPYVVDKETGRIDYDAIKKQAAQFKPKMIIAGASAYPWDIDWQRLRKIIDEVCPGTILMADIAHTAGLVVAGLFPNPIGFADAITYTTHKTLCGPRGAVIMTTDEEKAKRIDQAVFPGEQGGPHINNIAAKAVSFKIAQTQEFKRLQQKIVEDAKCLSDALQELGLKIAYGGTNTHLLLIDLNAIQTSSGVPLKGDVAANILDLCGITCNKNTIAGSASAIRPSGIRLGTVIPAQLGMGPKEMRKIAGLVHKVLISIQTFHVPSQDTQIAKGKIELKIIEEVRREVAELLGGHEPEPLATKPDTVTVSHSNPAPVCLTGMEDSVLEIRGERAQAFLQDVCTADIFKLQSDRCVRSLMLDKDGAIVADALVYRLTRDKNNFDRFAIQTDHMQKAETWLKGLSDGFIIFDDEDIYKKIQGPVEIRRSQLTIKKQVAPSAESGSFNSLQVFKTRPELFDLSKPYFIGQNFIVNNIGCAKKTCEKLKYEGYKGAPRRTLLYQEHLRLTSREFMFTFAGWSMPVWYTRASEEHATVRNSAGLFDVSHMGRLEITGDYVTRFLDLVTTNYVAKLRVGQAHYSYILDHDGNVMDDILVYRLELNHYILVVNAVNAEKIKAWLEAINSKKVTIDRDNPQKCVEGSVTITDLREPGPKQNVNLALQGPNSLAILQKLAGTDQDRKKLANLKKFHLVEVVLDGAKCIVARTGYTGEEFGFEIFVVKDDAVRIWNILLENGKELGIKPCGLAARDSARIEAGLPLYGHELDGEFKVLPSEAGYGAFIKRHKPFFIGRKPYLEKEARNKKQIVRFMLEASSARKIQTGDPVINKKGECIGVVTSASLVEKKQIGMAYVDRSYSSKGKKIGIIPSAKAEKFLKEKSKKNLSDNDRIFLREPATVLSRYLIKKARELSAPISST